MIWGASIPVFAQRSRISASAGFSGQLFSLSLPPCVNHIGASTAFSSAYAVVPSDFRFHSAADCRDFRESQSTLGNQNQGNDRNPSVYEQKSLLRKQKEAISRKPSSGKLRLSGCNISAPAKAPRGLRRLSHPKEYRPGRSVRARCLSHSHLWFLLASLS